jgi:uncharacterized protein (DUF302 family)
MTMEKNGLVHLTSKLSVNDVLERLLALLRHKSITLFAVVDHSGEAAKVGLEMHETKLVIFGNPKAGTPVMIAAPDCALDLPLKILIAEDPNGGTRVTYNSLQYFHERYGLTQEVLAPLAAVGQIAAAISETVVS